MTFNQFDLAASVEAANNIAHAGLKAGHEIAQREADGIRRSLQAIVEQYDACKEDPQARIPSRLALLIEAARPRV